MVPMQVIPKSHLQFQDWAPDFFDPEVLGKRGIRYDLLRVSDLPGGCAGITAHMEAGDLFLWDSRTLHGACTGVAPAVATPQKQPSPPELGRAIAYVCYSPKGKLTAAVAAQRRQALAAGVGFGHQAHHLDAKEVAGGGALLGGLKRGPQLRFGDLSNECKTLVA